MRKTVRDCIDEIEKLRVAGRYITLALGGAASDDEDCWTPEEVQRLFEHVCQRWPEFDPMAARESLIERLRVKFEKIDGQLNNGAQI